MQMHQDFYIDTVVSYKPFTLLNDLNCI